MAESKNEYPTNIKPLENQVAGHSFNEQKKDGALIIGMLRDEEGYVLKPVNKAEQGRREILFYETVSSSTQPDVVQLRQFVPQYHGSVQLAVKGSNTTFLKLTDATKNFKKPCVMDIKIGRQTWEPGSSLQKQLNEDAKYKECKQQCGFCIPGFQVYDVSTGELKKFGKDFGKKLNKENIPGVLKTFLNWSSGRSRPIGEEFLEQLNKILNWWRDQRVFHIYASSVLLTYDADILSLPQDCAFNNLKPIKTYVRVFLIDFAHVFPAENTPDLNYLDGLENFVEFFTSVINDL